MVFGLSAYGQQTRIDSDLFVPDPNPSVWQNQGFTGNWGGWREKLEKKGISIRSSFVTECLGNPVGGNHQAATYTGSYGLEVEFDGDKFLNWEGFELFASMAWRTGTSLSQKIGNIFTVQQIFGGQTIKLNELYFKQTAFKETVTFKAGRLNGGNDFLTSPLYCLFLNQAFCGNPSSIFYNTAFSNYPFAQWGAYLEWHPHPKLLLKGAVYNANTNVMQNRWHGLNFTFNSTNGVIWITECDLLAGQEDEEGYPGNYAAGIFYQTANTRIFSGGKGGDPGFYLQADQAVLPGITPFAALVAQPKDRNLMPFLLIGGIVFSKIAPARADDSFSLGFAYGKFSSDLATGQNFEALFEAAYNIQINPWFSLTPDFQYIAHPNGTAIPNAFCLGLQAEIEL